MKGLKTLCLMQLRDKMDFSSLKNKKTATFKIVFEILKFALITAVIYFGLYILSFLRLISLLPGIPQNFYVVVFTFILILSIIVCTFGLVKSLYFSKDNFVLLTMPVGKTQVFLSKIIVFTIYEFFKNLTFVLPLLLSIGIINKMPILFFVWLPIATMLFTLVSVSIGALLSIPMLFIENFIKSNKIIEYIVVFLLISGISVLLILLINAIPDNFDLVGTWGTTFWEIQTFLNKMNDIFLPFYAVTIAMVGTRYGISNHFFGKDQWICLGIIILSIAIIFALTFLIVRPIYFHMASTPFEYKKKKTDKKYKNKKLSAFKSNVKKDALLTYRTPEKFYFLIAISIGMPLAIFLLNKIYSAMDTRLTGTNMSIAFNILMIMLICLSSSSNLSHIISEEGGASYLIKTHPKSYLKSVLSKLTLNIVCIALSLLATVIIFVSYMKMGVIEGFIIYIALLAFYIGHMLYSVELDVMHPETERYQIEGMNLNSKNDLKSVIMAFAISIIVALITYFLISENMYTIWYKILAIAIIYVIYRIYLFVSKIEVYYKERV